jgi:hypothetical protein
VKKNPELYFTVRNRGIGLENLIVRMLRLFFKINIVCFTHLRYSMYYLVQKHEQVF